MKKLTTAQFIEKAKKVHGDRYDYCKQNSIKLIRIPYWDFKNIEEILERELNIGHHKINI